MYSISGRRSRVPMGTITAPANTMAATLITASAPFGSMTATRSPRRTPRARNPAERLSARAAS
jgi:hypothetical protein